MNENVNGSRKLFWKKVNNAKGGKGESCSRIKDGNEKLTQKEDEARRIWENILNICIIRNPGTGYSPHVWL